MSQTLAVIAGLVIAVVFALVCRNLAGARGRSKTLFTVLGFLFPVITLIVLLIIGTKKPATTT